MDTKSQSYCWDRSPLDKNVSDYRFRVVTIKNLLSRSKLDTTTKPSPRACGKNRVRNSFPLGSKPDDLFKDGFTFPIQCARRFKDNRGKVIIRIFESGSVSVNLLRLSV